MSDSSEIDICDFCRRGLVVKSLQQLSFRQLTRKGYISCRVNILVASCADCGARGWDKEAEAVIEDAVNREVEKLS
jgi:hypothetical protein